MLEDMMPSWQSASWMQLIQLLMEGESRFVVLRTGSKPGDNPNRCSSRWRGPRAQNSIQRPGSALIIGGRGMLSLQVHPLDHLTQTLWCLLVSGSACFPEFGGGKLVVDSYCTVHHRLRAADKIATQSYQSRAQSADLATEGWAWNTCSFLGS